MTRWPDPGRVAEIMREVAAEIVLPAADQGITEAQRRLKAHGELVTDIDEAAESVLSDRLAALTPGFAVLGEEGAAAEPGRLGLLREETPVWVIDPVDGTANFAAGSPHYGMIVALLHRGEVIAGWIYDPPGCRMAIAESGQGVSLGDRRPQLAADGPVDTLVGMPGYKLTDEVSRRQLAERAGRFAGSEMLGCAAHHYLLLLEGRHHFAASRRTKPWDHAAGALMLMEAGGAVRRIDGTPYLPADFAPPMIAASSEAVWQQVHEVLI